MITILCSFILMISFVFASSVFPNDFSSYDVKNIISQTKNLSISNNFVISEPVMVNNKIPNEHLCRKALSQLKNTNKKLAEFNTKWDTADFVYYFYKTDRPTIEKEWLTLEQIGLMNQIKNSRYTSDARKIIESNIYKYAKSLTNTGDLEYKDSIIVNYITEVFSFGKSTLLYKFKGKLGKRRNIYVCSGVIYISFNDAFADPLDMENIIKKLLKDKNTPQEIKDILQAIDVNCGGKVYYIEGHWQWDFTVSFIK